MSPLALCGLAGLTFTLEEPPHDYAVTAKFGRSRVRVLAPSGNATLPARCRSDSRVEVVALQGGDWLDVVAIKGHVLLVEPHRRSEVCNSLRAGRLPVGLFTSEVDASPLSPPHWLTRCLAVGSPWTATAVRPRMLASGQEGVEIEFGLSDREIPYLGLGGKVCVRGHDDPYPHRVVGMRQVQDQPGGPLGVTESANYRLLGIPPQEIVLMPTVDSPCGRKQGP